MGPILQPGIADIAPYVAGESHIAGQNRVIKLSSNEGAFGASPGARAAFRDAADALHLYPDGSHAALRAALGTTFGLDPARIVCGAGSDDLLYQLGLAYAGVGDEIIMTAHGFSMYEIIGRYAGARVRRVAERPDGAGSLLADIDAILAAVSAATRVVFLANPNNPTGTVLPIEALRSLRARLPDQVLLVIDSAYAEYVDDLAYDPGASLVDAHDNVVMTRTFSKIFGLGGLRIGWCYAPAGIVDVMNRIRGPFNISLPAQRAAIAALAEPGWLAMSRAHNTQTRESLTVALRAMGIVVPPSVANFILPDFRTPERADAADAFLRKRGIIVRRMGGYGLPSRLRITIGPAEHCAMLVDALNDFTQMQPANV